jgi:hypothetical protein
LSRPQTLLLSGTPPGSRLVGEIILRDFAFAYGPENLRCVAVSSPRFRHSPDERLHSLPVLQLHSELVRAQRKGTSALAALRSHAAYRLGFEREVSALVERIVADAGKVEQVFAVLDNALMFALAHRVASRLGVPLLTLVWDPPEYLLRQVGFDRWSRKSLLAEFRRSLAASRRVGVVSETMRSDYAAFTEAPILIFRHGLPPGEATPVSRGDDSEWVIGFAGSMYSTCGWRAFLAALDLCDWTIAGRPVRLRLLTNRIELRSRKRAQIDFLGFRSVEEVQTMLANCDLAYLPQPFVSHLRELARYSFPTKLSNYLALGLPVLVHSPSYGALSEFFSEHPVGVHASNTNPEAIVNALENMLGQPALLAEARATARSVAASEFSDVSFRAAVERLVAGAQA